METYWIFPILWVEAAKNKFSHLISLGGLTVNIKIKYVDPLYNVEIEINCVQDIVKYLNLFLAVSVDGDALNTL